MNTELRQSLLAELADLERQYQDPTLTDSDRQRLDQVWEDTHDRLDDLDGLFITIPMVDDREWRDAREALRTPTPPPASPIRFAPSPPPIILGVDAPLPPFPPVARSVSSHGPPPLSSTHLQGRHPLELQNPDPLEIPRIDHLIHSVPPPPRPWEPSEEDIERANAWEDDRPDCSRCSGCYYCSGYGYDEADEF